jgi:hypothetical protein
MHSKIKTLLALLIACTIFNSCQTTEWKPSQIFIYDHGRCMWIDNKDGEITEIECDSHLLESYMAIPIDDYIHFRENYICTLKENLSKKQRRKLNNSK